MYKLKSVFISYKSFKNSLFSNLFNSIFSLLLIIIIGCILTASLKWFFLKAKWEVITSNLPLFTFGSYPPSQTWRPTIWIISLFLLCGVTLFGPKRKWLRKNLIYGWISTLPIGFYLLYGGFGLSPVMSRHWGGLTLTIFLTVCSLIFALPLGILLALCRQSSFSLIKKISGFYIDLMRSVPLIAVLFFGQLLIPLFLPLGLELDRVGELF